MTNMFSESYCTLLAAAFVTITQATQNGSFEDYKRLYGDLYDSAEVRIRPVSNQSSTLQVTVIPVLVSLKGINEKEQVMESTVTLQLQWTQETLTWNPAQYGGFESVSISPTDTWTPDLVFENLMSDNFMLLRHDEMKVGLQADGRAQWYTSKQLRTSCKVEIQYYPFDTQVCYINIGKMHSPDSELGLVPGVKEMLELDPNSNDEWKVIGTGVRVNTRATDHSVLEIMVTLKRRSLFYVLNVIAPVVVMALMTAWCFKIPAESGERLGYCISLFLSFVVLLNVTADSMPKVSKTISYLQLYINIQFLISMLSTCFSIIQVRLTYVDPTKTTTARGLTTLLLCFITRDIKKVNAATPAATSDDNNDDNDGDDYKNSQKDQHREVNRGKQHREVNRDKMLVAIERLDNFMFLVFLFLFVASTVLCLGALLVHA